MLVAILTIHQKDSLMNQLVQPNWFFNPFQDGNENWVITEQEIDNSVYPEHDWVKDLSLSEFIPIPEPSI